MCYWNEFLYIILYTFLHTSIKVDIREIKCKEPARKNDTIYFDYVMHKHAWLTPRRRTCVIYNNYRGVSVLYRIRELNKNHYCEKRASSCIAMEDTTKFQWILHKNYIELAIISSPLYVIFTFIKFIRFVVELLSKAY